MDRKKTSKAPYIVMVLLALAIAGLMLYILPYRYRLNQTVSFSESDKVLDNPLTGFAPPAENGKACADMQLVYIGLTWAEWEPKEGEFAVDALEETFHLKRWREEGKHAVLRFVCDTPGETGHMDIPQWLFEKTGDGFFYENSYGGGYSPDYANTDFREAHERAIMALAEYCNRDSFVAYVELGSLGHWGEWHTNTREGVPALPGADVCWEYVLDYSDHFHNALLLMRRNYSMAYEGGMGIYNDMTGSGEATREWLSWQKEESSYETSGEALELVPMEDFWKWAPCGGEFTSSIPMEVMLGQNLGETLELIEESHMTFLGPKCPVKEEAALPGAEAVRRLLGYRFYISGLTTRYSFLEGRIDVAMTWENTGIAPFYWDWPVTMYVYDREGELAYWETLELRLSRLMPGNTLEAMASIPFTDRFRHGFRIGIGIAEPEGTNRIRLAMEGEEKEGVQVIYSYEGE